MMAATGGIGLLFWALAGLVEPQPIKYCSNPGTISETDAGLDNPVVDVPGRRKPRTPLPLPSRRADSVPVPIQYLPSVSPELIPFEPFVDPLLELDEPTRKSVPRGDFELRRSTRESAGVFDRTRPSPAA